MRQTTQGGFLGKGMGNDIYGSLFDMEIAKVFAERGLGLGEMILKQINGREENKSGNPISPPKDLKLSSLTQRISSGFFNRPADRGIGSQGQGSGDFFKNPGRWSNKLQFRFEVGSIFRGRKISFRD